MIRTRVPRPAVLLGTAGLLCALGAAACSTTTGGSGGAVPADSGARSSFAPQSGPAFTSSLSVTTTATSFTATAPAPSTHPVPSAPLRTDTAQGQNGTTYRVDLWAEVNTPTCADHAYGAPMIAFLRAHQCVGLTRKLATTTVSGRGVGLAISDLGFRDPDPASYRSAGQFVTLVSKDGTGNLDDLLREGYRLPSGPTRVPSPDAFSALGQDNGVEVVDAWYLSGPTPDNDPALVQLAQSIFLQLH
jgi:hypothetical protein